ncbi:hypothetical protein BH10ACI2_BH10ACI2_12800 [soil metagenome]
MKKTKYLTACALGAVLFGASSSCQNAGNTGTSANQAANSAVATSNKPVYENTPDPEAKRTGSPSDAYRAAFAARKSKDIDALKKLMSKDILEFFELMGNADPKKKMTVDEVLKDLCEKPQNTTAETRNELVDGDKAKIEYLDEKGQWSPMDFVKEDGVWKLTIDRSNPDESKSNSEKPKSNK